MVGLTEGATLSEIDHLGNLLHIVAVDHWVGVDWNQNFISLAVNSDCIVIVLVRRKHIMLVLSCTGWRELNVDVFADSCWHHASLLVANFEVGRLWGQNVQPLRRRRVVDNSDFESVSFICLETCKFHH